MLWGLGMVTSLPGGGEPHLSSHYVQPVGICGAVRGTRSGKGVTKEMADHV